MRFSELNNLRVGVLGVGLEGLATIAALRRHGYIGVIHAFDDVSRNVPEGVVLHVGNEGFAALGNVDTLVRSPGFKPAHPARVAADARALSQTTSTNLFLAEVRAAGISVIGITGSKGKSTTSALTQRILQEAGVNTVLVGNIGEPALEYLDQVLAEKPVVVMELSSYQCDDLELGPSTAALLDLFPEHLDWHGGVEKYYVAKLGIARSQREGDRFFYNASAVESSHGLLPALLSGDELRSSATAMNTPDGLHFSDGWFMRGAERLCSDEEMLLPGLHNRRNAIAAFALAEAYGARPEHLVSVLRSFRGLPFRQQDEGMHDGIRWINDSLSTAPEAIAVALDAWKPVHTLIAGGYDRGYDPETIVPAIAASGVRELILMPDTGAPIAAAVRTAGLGGIAVHEVADLEAAVALAKEKTPAGTTALFSPGAPSYNQYRSFVERGEHLQRLIAHG